MKRISKGAYFAAGLLLLWAAADLYHYAVIGNRLLSSYGETAILRRLVGDSLFQGVVKIGVGALILFLSWMRRGGEKKQTGTLRAISARIGALLMALWLVFMTTITLSVAQYVFQGLAEVGVDFSTHVYAVGQLGYLYEDYGEDPYVAQRRQIPGMKAYSMNQAIADSGTSLQAPSYDFYPGPCLPEWMNILEGGTRCETAVVFLDHNGNVIRQSSDFLYFGYLSQEAWQAGDETPTGYGWIDLGDEEDARYTVLRTLYAGDKTLWDLMVLRLTGYFEGERFEPMAMDFLTRSAYYRALEAVQPQEEIFQEGAPVIEETPDFSPSATTSGSGGGEEPAYTLSELDAMGVVEWEQRFDNTASADGDLVTIYATHPEMSVYEPEGPVVYQKTEVHENLLALLNTMGYYQGEGTDIYSGASQFDLWDMVVFSSVRVRDMTHSAGEQSLPEVEFTILTALRGSPLRIAASYLERVYLITFLLVLMGFLLLRGSIKKHLVVPMQAVNQGIEEGWTHLTQFREKKPKWTEPHLLIEHYVSTQDTLRRNKNEIARLSTALDYAKQAEGTRRRMTSDIAHELKTPLAVIHSYAEGLKEHIAEEKRDKYIDVILSEAERTDAMVLEMLDLSRLEAGRVKLSRDDVSLPDLTRSIFEKLERAIEGKQLKLSFEFPEQCVVFADESRIGQVIENLAANAVQYTPAGGRVTVRIRSRKKETEFSIENESPPLSGEVIGKVWDAFYRADTSRSDRGTGLGLAIAKNIITLHGGRCFARNTQTGVEFGFIL